MQTDHTFVLADGARMPAIGYGTWKSQRGGETANGVRWALEAGYRHIDCAPAYVNEDEVGLVLEDVFKTSSESTLIRREDVWVTTKLWNTCHRRKHVHEAVMGSLERLKLEYVDLLLVHWPVSFRMSEEADASKWPTHWIDDHPVLMPPRRDGEKGADLENVPIAETWAALEKLVHEGRVKNLGVSNFTERHLDELLAVANIKPVVNQVEMHPYFRQDDLLAYCWKHNVHCSAYCPLAGSPDMAPKNAPGLLLEDPLLVRLADKYSCTPANIALRWALQRGTSVLPKSVVHGRIASNLHGTLSITLTDEDMDLVNSIEYQHRYNNPEASWNCKIWE